MITCPCCKQPMPEQDSPDFLVEIGGMQPMDRKIIAALASVFPKSMTRYQLADSIYADDPDGGPEYAWGVISVRLTSIRPAIEKYGWTVPKNGSGGPGTVGRYRLERVDA